MRCLWRPFAPLILGALLSSAVLAQQPVIPLAKPSVVFKVESPNDRLEMTVHTSRILTMDQKIPQAQVNNPDILEVTPLSPTQVQVSAKAAGVTQINLWGEDKKLYTIDVMVYGDARELEMILRSTFPNAALKVVPVANSVMISGFVDKPEHIDRIIRIAEEYYPKVLNNMTVSGVQQVLLHIKVMEVSRTKLRRLGFDWGQVSGSSIVSSTPVGLLADHAPSDWVSPPGLLTRTTSSSTLAVSAVDGNNAFFGVLDALRHDNLMKIMAEPTLVTISGRAASFFAGGQVAIPEAGALGTTGVDYKSYGTTVNFIPIVLGNGRIRLEVRPEVSELDYANGTTISGTTVPGFRSRKADTGVELMAGQTLAIAGLVQSRVEAENRGVPWISEVPYLGAAFRKVEEKVNEVELLILVTPELVDGMDADEVPPCGPGMQTTSPSDWELFMKGHLEVPNCCPAGDNCGGNCQNGDDAGDNPPPDGMILHPGEKVPTPPPAGSTGRSTRSVRNGPNAVARRPSGVDSGASSPHSRHTSSKPNPSTTTSSKGTSNGPPGIIGPVGYDVVK